MRVYNLRFGYFILLLISIFINSCKSDFSIIAPYKQITVVYGLLDPAASVQYIKVNKAFLGQGNALVMAQQTDSINYKPGVLNVQLQSSQGQIIQLDTATTIPKSPGLFANPYQLLYVTPPNTTIIQDGVTTYNLIIYNSSDQQTVTSNTPIVGAIPDTLSMTPAPGEQVNFTGLNGPLQNVNFTAVVNGRIYNLIIRFSYIETNTQTGKDTAKYIDWNIGTQVSQQLNGSEQITFAFNKADFYSFVASQLVAAPYLKRTIGGNPLDFMIFYGADNLNTYIDVNQPSIGIVQDVPAYTDIVGGVGLFSSRSSYNDLEGMDAASIDSLQTGQVTGALNFQ